MLAFLVLAAFLTFSRVETHTYRGARAQFFMGSLMQRLAIGWLKVDERSIRMEIVSTRARSNIVLSVLEQLGLGYCVVESTVTD